LCKTIEWLVSVDGNWSNLSWNNWAVHLDTTFEPCFERFYMRLKLGHFNIGLWEEGLWWGSRSNSRPHFLTLQPPGPKRKRKEEWLWVWSIVQFMSLLIPDHCIYHGNFIFVHVWVWSSLILCRGVLRAYYTCIGPSIKCHFIV
jgi:hypothetical protein